MLKGYRITDVDGHVQEPRDLWERRLEPRFLADLPRLQADGRRYYRGQERNYKLSEPVLAAFTRRTLETYREQLEAGWDPASQIRAMDRMGVDVSYLYPTDGLFMWHFRNMDPAHRDGAHARLQRLAARVLAVRCRRACGRSRRSRSRIPRSRWSSCGARTAKLGMRAIYIRPNPVDGRTLGRSRLEPIWEECEQRGIAVGIHEGAHCQLETAGAERFRSDFALWSCSHPMEQMMAFLALLEGGRARAASRGCAWRSSRRAAAGCRTGCGASTSAGSNVAFEVADNVRMPPSDYFRRQCWVALEADEPYLEDVIAPRRRGPAAVRQRLPASRPLARPDRRDRRARRPALAPRAREDPRREPARALRRVLTRARGGMLRAGGCTVAQSFVHAGVHHVSLNVHDADQTGRFYTEVLGFEKLPRPDFGVPGLWLRCAGQEVHLIQSKDHNSDRRRSWGRTSRCACSTSTPRAALLERGVRSASRSRSPAAVASASSTTPPAT